MRRLGLGLSLASLLFAGDARAYCRTTTCEDCPRDEEGCATSGTELAWPSACVGVSLHFEASRRVDLATVQELAEQAFATWNDVVCEPSGLPPSIELRGTGEPVVCGRSEWASDAANANIVVFRDDAWPYRGEGHDLATTTVRSREDGAIIDADIEINATRPLLFGDTGQQQGTIVGAHDLQSILTHEFGHLLGLDHSADPDSIMQVELPPRVVRTALGEDDIAAICEAYPPERDALPCDPAPRGAFSAQCALDPSTGGACAAIRPGGAGRRRTAGAVWWLALALVLRARSTGGRARIRASRASTAVGRDAPGSRRRLWRQR